MIFPYTLRPADPEVADLAAHEADTANPHVVTAAQAGAVALATYDAHTILAATSDNTPAAVTIAESTVLGRLPAGEIAALTGAQVGAMIALGDLSDVGTATPTSGHVLTGNGTSWGNAALAASLPEPGGTPTAGYVPVATGTGQASTWTAPTVSEPGPVMLFSAVVADGATTGTTTGNAPVMTTAGIAWSFVVDGAAFETLFGAGQWKITLKVYYSTENGADDMKFQLYNLGTAAVIGTDQTLAGSVLYALGSVSWATGLPTTLSRLNICFYNGTASGAGHTIYGYGFHCYAEAI